MSDPTCTIFQCAKNVAWSEVRSRFLNVCEQHREKRNAQAKRSWDKNRESQLEEQRARRKSQRALLPRCLVDACQVAREHADGLCRSHHKRALRDGHPGDDSLSRQHRNGLNDQGYRIVSTPSGRKLEHRHVVEQHLGRYLWAFENVHHKNGLRADNRIDNLELWVTSQPSGQRPEDLAAWVVQHYPEIVRQALADTEAHTRRSHE